MCATKSSSHTKLGYTRSCNLQAFGVLANSCILLDRYFSLQRVTQFARVIGTLFLFAMLGACQPSANSKIPLNVPNPIFAMSYGFPDFSIEEQIDFLAGSGFDGIALHIWNDETFENLWRAQQKAQVTAGHFKIFGLYMPVDIQNSRHRELLSRVIDAVEAQSIPLWVTTKNREVSESDIVAFYRELTREAAAKSVDIVIYPHDRHFILSAEGSLKIIRQVEADNLYTTLHLNHELRKGNGARLEAVVRNVMPYVKLASLSGANELGLYNQGSRDWSDVVQALTQTKFDVHIFYKLLQRYEYRGPVGYNNFGIAGDPRIHHRETLAIIRSWQK